MMLNKLPRRCVRVEAFKALFDNFCLFTSVYLFVFCIKLNQERYAFLIMMQFLIKSSIGAQVAANNRNEGRGIAARDVTIATCIQYNQKAVSTLWFDAIGFKPFIRAPGILKDAELRSRLYISPQFAFDLDASCSKDLTWNDISH